MSRFIKALRPAHHSCRDRVSGSREPENKDSFLSDWSFCTVFIMTEQVWWFTFFIGEGWSQNRYGIDCLDQGFLNFFVPWASLKILWNLWKPSHKNVFKYIKYGYWKLLKLTNILGVQWPLITVSPIFIFEWTAEFQSEVSGNKILIFSSSKFTEPIISVSGPSRGTEFPIYERLL